MRRRLILIMLLSILLIIPTAHAWGKRTGFNPSKHGFNFGNDFNNDAIKEVDLRTGGLCGGMVYTALDYFVKRRPIPRQDYRPANRTRLQSYIYNRQMNSFKGLDKWIEVGFNPGGARNSEFFEWGLKGFGGGRLQELRKCIDGGRPAILGVWGVGGASHQVMAIGYDLGRYKGDLRNYKQDLKIYIYDPNHPNRTFTLVPNLTGKYFYYKEKPSKKWRTYFVDARYRASYPPNIPNPKYPGDGKVRELVIRFDTGRDDLRGGNDNVNAVINLADGSQQSFRNINLRARWLSNYSECARVVLKKAVYPKDILNIVFSTTFRGGVGGDNWDVNAISIRGIGGNVDKTLRDYKRRFRFTGHRKSLTVAINSAPRAKKGQVSSLMLSIRTGGDDLRGGNDNLNVTVLFRNGQRFTVNNVNRSRRWKDNTSTTVFVKLNRPVSPSEIRGLILTTTFSGGMGGDNWNMDSLKVQPSGSGQRTLYNRSGRPLFRFTGSRRTFTARW
ncbi:MAG: hypothetical protein GY940_47910 [bacterium]|nr:hypothetical protein [bacterium]